MEVYNYLAKLLDKYKEIFPKDEKIYTNKLGLVLELFFEIK
jgi:hypothetical protein